MLFRIIALSVALGATAGAAGAQAAKTAAKSTVQTRAAQKSAVHHRPVKKAETQSELQAQAKISEETARATALREIPNGTVKSSELEREKGKLVYSFDIRVPGKSGVEEVAIDAIDGSLVAHTHETARMEKKEAAKEAKENKAKK